MTGDVAVPYRKSATGQANMPSATGQQIACARVALFIVNISASEVDLFDPGRW